MKFTPFVLALGLVILAFSPCRATELLLDTGFEQSGTSGTSGQFVGWTIQNQVGGHGSFSLETPGAPTTSQIWSPTPSNPSGGNYYAVTDTSAAEGGYPGAHALLQTFVVPENFLNVTLNFQMFINDFLGISGTGNALDYTTGANYVRVDILTADAAIADPFTIGTGVVGNLILGGDANTGYNSYNFDLTPYLTASGTYAIRFADVTQGGMSTGVDNVSIQVAPVPEPSSVILLGLGAAGLVWKGRKRFCR